MGAEFIVDSLEDMCDLMCNNSLPARIGSKVNNICGECKYFGVVTDKQMDVCKHKDPNQNVVEYDTRACKHYEKWERGKHDEQRKV